ncbi:MAG: TrpB-like pyridoxal phosphate-dependent enzyme [Oscillospiraceae bacterium]|jgi:tryptophan synthase beta chain|nr:TrpB-like pyridoxal phosphate-dependent enzyme [Oscillospiraceae bacterium]
MAKQDPYRIYLTEEQIPKQWLNIRGFMKDKPDPMIHPGTGKPIVKEDLLPIFCDELAAQELDEDNKYVDIPDEVREFYKLYRPSPLCRAYNLEKALGTPAKIYYKFEGNNTSGSHKLNAAVPMAYYAKEQGLKGLTTETGAGQWGTALSIACKYYGLDLCVYMVSGSFKQKPYRKAVIETYGAKIIASPSNTTNAGRAVLAEHPDTSGSLGCAISEAVEVAVQDPSLRYVLGSVMNQVLLHQSVIGIESKTAMEQLNAYPDIIIGCAGGGSNLGGLIAPFVADKLEGKANPYIIAVEPASCPSLTRGTYAYDFGDIAKITPLVKMYTLGCEFLPSPNHAGGLRYHGMSPLVSKLYHDKLIDKAISAEQTKVFEAAKLFAQSETILPAPESSHAIYAAVQEALKCKESGEAKTILFGLTGTGYFDMTAYMDFNAGTMGDYIPTDEEIKIK